MLMIGLLDLHPPHCAAPKLPRFVHVFHVHRWLLVHARRNGPRQLGQREGACVARIDIQRRYKAVVADFSMQGLR